MDLRAGPGRIGDPQGGQGTGGGSIHSHQLGLGVPITFRGFSGVGASSTEASISLAGIQVS